MKYLLTIGLSAFLLSCQAVSQHRHENPSVIHSSNQNPTMPDSLQLNLDILASEHGADREACVQWLLSHANRSHPALRELIANEKTSSWQRANALSVLEKMGNPSDISFLADYAVTHEDNRWNAFRALAYHADPGAQEALLQLANSKEEAIAANALVALGIRGEEPTRAFLEEQLVSGTPKIRWKAAHALSLMGVEASRSLLEKQLTVEQDKDVLEKLTSLLQAKN